MGLRIAVLTFVLVGQIFPTFARAATAPTLNPGSQSIFEDAIRRLNDGEYDAATIQLKNVLQENPRHIPSRILLGRVYLRQGFGSAAEKELREASRQGADQNHINVPLGNALLLQRKYQEILDTINNVVPGVAGGFEVMIIRGRAYLELRELDKAQDSFRAASELNPKSGNSWLGLARVAVARAEYGRAKDHINRALDINPKHAEAWYQNGDVRRLSGDIDGAIEAFTQTLVLSPRHMRARLARGSLYLYRSMPEEALADAEFARETIPSDPTAAFIMWQALLRLGRPADARQAFKDAAVRISSVSEANIVEQPSLLRIAGFIALANRDYERANHYLTLMVIADPNDYPVKKLLAEVQIQLGEFKGAISSLFPMREKHSQDAELFALLGQAYMGDRHFGEAVDALERAVALTPDNTAVRKQLALGRVATGKTNEAIDDLKRVVGFDAGGASAGILLVTLQIKNKQAQEALVTVNNLLRHDSENPVLLNLLGTVLLANNDRDEASLAFEKAQGILPDFVPPIFNLAQMDLDAGRFNAADKRFNRVLKIDPNSAAAYQGKAQIARYQGREKDAIRALKKAIKIDRNASAAFRQLVELYLNAKNYREANRLSDDYLSRNPESMEAHKIDAKIKAATGNTGVAELNYRRASRYAGFSSSDLFEIARGQVEIKDFEGARSTLLRATQSGSKIEAYAALARLEIVLHNIDASINWANRAVKEDPQTSIGHTLLAEAYMKRGDLSAAISSYRNAMKKESLSINVIGVAAALREMGKMNESVAELRGWMKANPRDVIVERELAFSLLLDGQLETAQSHLERLLKFAPENGSILVNLARCYQLQRDPRAKGLAEKAVDLNPEWAVALDTLGWILVTNGEAKVGLSLLRDAYARDDNPLIRFHLASALLELGRVSEARSELSAIVETSANLPWIGDVRAVYEKAQAVSAD